MSSVMMRIEALVVVAVVLIGCTQAAPAASAPASATPATAAATAPAASASASSTRTTAPYTLGTVLIGARGAVGAVYQPTSPSGKQSIAFVVIHEDANTIESDICTQLAQRGYTMLCIKSEFGQQAQVTWDALALDVAGAVKYLRGLSAVKKVVLIGYSGGGSIMSYYQNVAQNGVAACQAPERLNPCGNAVANMPPADGVILGDAIPGIAFSDLSALDASVVNEQDPRARDASLDMYAAPNDFSASGPSSYAPAFIDRYTAAQGARMDRLIAQAQDLLKQARDGKGPYANDAPMPVGRLSARIWEADLSLLSHTKGKYPLISPEFPDGSPPQVINSLRVTSADPTGNQRWDPRKGGFSAATFLSIAAIKAPNLRIAADSITGVDWASTNTSTVLNVAGIRSPLLIMSMTGHYWIVPSEMYLEAATKATDKTLVYIKGASHGLTPCDRCAKTPGEFGDTVKEIFNYIDKWATQRFGS